MAGLVKRRNVKLTSWFGVCVILAIFAIPGYITSAEEPAASQNSSASDTKDETTKEISYPSPDGKFSFLIGRGEYEHTIDLIDKGTEKVQHIADDDMSSVSYKVLWAPDSKRFALMTRAGHPNQDVSVYFLQGDNFHEIKIPDLTAEIPAEITAGKEHPHVSANNWQEAEKWNKDGSLLLTIDNTIDGAGHTASATRTVVLGFGKSGKPKILKSTVKYESRNDED